MKDTVFTAVNGGLVIEEQKNGIRFGTDAVLLADFVGKYKMAVELGSGSGIISFLTLKMLADANVTGIEFNASSAEISLSNAKANGLYGRFDCVNIDVLDTKKHFESGKYDCVFSNPPYLKKNNGFVNASSDKFTAFHETTADMNDFSSAASYLLKHGGRFCVVYRAEYLSKLIRSMEANNIRPKKMRLICPSVGKSPTLVLVEGKKGANDGLLIEPPFYIYADGTHTEYTPEMKAVYNKFSL